MPQVQRDSRNRRVFDERTVAWVKDLACLKKCGMSIAEMKEYLALCLEGERSITQRQVMLARKSEELEEQMKTLQESLDYIA